MRTMGTLTSCCFALALAALLMPSASFAGRPAECDSIAPSAGRPPAELAALCGVAAGKSEPRRTPSDMAVSPDGVLEQCASMILGSPENVSLVGSIPFQPACDFANNDFTKLYCLDDALPI